MCEKEITTNKWASPNAETITAGYPTQVMAVDLLGPLPESNNGNSYVLVVGDYYSKWMEALPVPNQEAPTVVEKLVDEVFLRFLPSEQLHSDQGRQFESVLIVNYYRFGRLEPHLITPSAMGWWSSSTAPCLAYWQLVQKGTLLIGNNSSRRFVWHTTQVCSHLRDSHPST